MSSEVNLGGQEQLIKALPLPQLLIYTIDVIGWITANPFHTGIASLTTGNLLHWRNVQRLAFYRVAVHFCHVHVLLTLGLHL